MASVSHDRKGNVAIQFMDADGKRRTIRLGKLADTRVQAIRHNVELLVVAQKYGHELDAASVEWIIKLSPVLRAKLGAVGILVPAELMSQEEATRRDAVVKLGDVIAKLNKEIAFKTRRCEMLSGRPMPEVPAPFIRLNRENQRFACPSAPGIYFVWDRFDIVVYVGKSANLNSRVGRKHEHINIGESVSWIERQVDELSLDELFYIWLLKPCRNRESYPYTPGSREERE